MIRVQMQFETVAAMVAFFTPAQLEAAAPRTLITDSTLLSKAAGPKAEAPCAVATAAPVTSGGVDTPAPAASAPAKRGRPAKNAAAPAEPPAQPTAEAPAAAAPTANTDIFGDSPAPAEKTYTIDELRVQLGAVNEKHGMETLTLIMDRNGVTTRKLRDIKPEQFADVMAMAVKALATADTKAANEAINAGAAQ